MIKKYLKLKKAASVLLMALPAFMQVNAQTVVTYTYTGAMQQFTVPPLCVPSVTIQAKGGQGGFNTASLYGSGLGADMTGVFAVSAGQVLKILVGQQPSNTASNGGGGGTFVTDISNNPLIIAGGGGGSAGVMDSPNKHGQTGTAGAQGAAGGTGIGGTGGINGNGGNVGTSSYNSGAGGGLLTNGAAGSSGATSSGIAFVNGGAGGTNNGFGGFGGGGAGSLNYVGGGGGGYSGGGGGGNDGGVGGGGGSFNNGTGQVNVGGSNTGNGIVIISYFAQIPIPVAVTSSVICNGSSTNLTGSGMVTYTWLPVGAFAGSNSAAITVTPNTTTTYSVVGTSASGCPGYGAITITVSPALPTLTITSSSPTVCLGNTITLTATGALTHTWTGGISNGVAFAPASTTGYTVTGTNGCGTGTAAITVTVGVLPIFVSASSTLVCASTAATLMAGGATTYTWMPGTSTQTNYITNPAANTVYTVTGKIGNCLGTNTIAITTKPNPTITIAASTATICDGGSVVLTANGGVTYTWNPVGSSNTMVTVSPTLSTLYTVVGTNAVNCNASASQVILVNAKPVINVSATDAVVCPGGGSTLTATGASTYLWDGTTAGATLVVHPVVTTTYAVVGTGTNTCSNATMITVGVFDPSLTVSSSTAVCRGTNVNLSASGMDTYQWSTGSGFSSINVTPTITTTYSVNTSSTQGAVTCSVNGAVTVSVNPNPTVTASGSPTIICKGETAVITASGAVTYTWSGSTPEVAAAITVTPSADQTYTVAGHDVNGCRGSGTTLLRVAGCVGIASNALNENGFSVYPNPSNGNITISSDQTIDLKITNELGQLVKSISLNSNTTKINISDLNSGIYFITGKNENGEVKQKIIVAK